MSEQQSKAKLTPMERMRLVFAWCTWVPRSRAHWGIGKHDKAVSELRREVASSTPISKSDEENNTTDVWSRHRQRVRHLLLTRNPAGFLSWAAIVSSMTFGLLPFIRTEFLMLRRSTQWQTRWRDALRENRAGLPLPSHVYPATSGTLIHHAYHLHRFECVTGQSIVNCHGIVEFGGGYGSMARLITRLGFRGPYHIHDLPEFSALQRFYLRAVRSEVGEGEHAEALSKITFSSLREQATPLADLQNNVVFLATWSFSEIPVSLRDDWRPVLARFRYFLFGFQDQFEGIDNRAWFDEFVEYRTDIEWRFESAVHRGEGVRYLFGVPKHSASADDRDLRAKSG